MQFRTEFKVESRKQKHTDLNFSSKASNVKLET